MGSIEGSFGGHIYSINEGIVGWSIQNQKVYSLKSSDSKIINLQFDFEQREKRPERTGSFMFIPLINQVNIGIGFETIT